MGKIMTESLSINPISSLKKKVVSGTIWTILGHGGQQTLRLAGNLILTRLLFPEAFGLMALVHILLQGLKMFSDIGLNVSVIRSERGDDLNFINTVWTVQIIRGFLLWLFCCLLAWPMASFYQQPILLWLIPVTGVTTLIDGFKSTKIMTLNRSIQIKRLTLVEISQQVIGLCVMIPLAYYYRSVWALVIGGIVGTFGYTIISHIMIPGYTNRLHFDRSSWEELYHFGKWIFIATIMTFFGSQGDRIFLGKVLSIDLLGIYSIAYFFSQATIVVVTGIVARVLLPVYSHIEREASGKIREKIFKIRIGILGLALPPLWFLAIFGERLIQLIYDPRYHQAGWILEMLSLGSLMAIINLTINPILLAKGNSFRHMILTILRVIMLFLLMGIGWHFNGFEGLIYGVLSCSYFMYPINAAMVRPLGVWFPLLDFSAITLSFIIIGLGKHLFF